MKSPNSRTVGLSGQRTGDSKIQHTLLNCLNGDMNLVKRKNPRPDNFVFKPSFSFNKGGMNHITRRSRSQNKYAYSRNARVSYFTRNIRTKLIQEIDSMNGVLNCRR